jgi:hypothetical protein
MPRAGAVFGGAAKPVLEIKYVHLVGFSPALQHILTHSCQTRLAVRSLLWRALGSAECGAYWEAGPHKPRINIREKYTDDLERSTEDLVRQHYFSELRDTR